MPTLEERIAALEAKAAMSYNSRYNGEDVDDSVDNTHKHTNKVTLDKISEEDGQMTYSGETIKGERGFPGRDGEPGKSATVTVEETVTGTPDTPALVENVGTETNARFRFVIPQGKRGEDGTGVTILGSYGSYAELKTSHPTGNVGDSYIIVGDLWVWSPTSNDWVNAGQIQGPQGEAGKTPEKGVDYFDGADGEDGTDGVSPTVRVAETVTGAPGTLALVENVGTETDVQLKFTIPQGQPGEAAEGGSAELVYIASTSGTNTYVATVENYGGYKVGQPILVRFSNANTGASTLNINGMGAKKIVRTGNAELMLWDIIANSIHQLVYDGTSFQVQTQGGKLTVQQLATPLEGLESYIADAELNSSNAIVMAFGRLQGQVNALKSSGGGYVTGTFSGDGAASRTINLGFTPKAVLVVNSFGQMYYALETANYDYSHAGGLAVTGRNVVTQYGGSANVLSITTNGFIVYYSLNTGARVEVSTNGSGRTFNYIAFK